MGSEETEISGLRCTDLTCISRDWFGSQQVRWRSKPSQFFLKIDVSRYSYVCFHYSLQGGWLILFRLPGGFNLDSYQVREALHISPLPSQFHPWPLRWQHTRPQLANQPSHLWQPFIAEMDEVFAGRQHNQTPQIQEGGPWGSTTWCHQDWMGPLSVWREGQGNMVQ